MKNFIKLTGLVTATLLMIAVPSVWCGDLQTNMMGGGWPGGGNPGGGFFGGGMMGGGSMMNQLRAADLDGDHIPEIVTIANGTYLVILDNEGNVQSSKPLPSIPTQTFQLAPRASGLDVADLDGDGVPEIITEYRGYYATYLVVLDNQGNLKSYKQLQYNP